MNKIAKEIRNEPFQTFRNNCLRKSLKFRRECRKIGISSQVVLALVITPCRRFPLPPNILWFHAWVEVDGERVELARPLDEKNSANSFDIELRPLIAVRI